MTKAFIFKMFAVWLFALTAYAQSTDISYQGRLDISSQPANANYDFEFRLYDAPAGGNLLGTETRSNVIVVAGVFSVRLGFSAALFSGASRFLEISVRPAGDPGGYQQLLPRQAFTSVPAAFRSFTADNALRLGGILAGQFVLTNDVRLSNDRSPLPNSPHYIQNSTTPQATSSFNISGNGSVGGTLTANIVSAATQFDLGSARFLISGPSSIGIGPNVGRSNGFLGGNNAFVGSGIASQIEMSNRNAVFGIEAGTAIDDASGNSFFGYRAGFISTGGSNAFFGSSAGDSTTIGVGNTFIGASSGAGNTTGGGNTFVGRIAGLTNTTGANNTLLGDLTDFASGDLQYATAIGAGAVVGLSNTILLGRTDGSDRVQIPGQLQLVSLATGGVTNLCRTTTAFVATCSSSLRYKTAIENFTEGLSIVRRLRPISFDWKGGGLRDVGFAAEEVNEVEPRLVTFEKGRIEGVKYAQVTTVLVNAVKEQQAEIDDLRQQLRELKALVCGQKPSPSMCDRKEAPRVEVEK